MGLFENTVKETVSSGIEPVTLKYISVRDCYSARPVAYRTETELFSTASGMIAEAAGRIDGSKEVKDFCLHNMAKAIRAIRAFGKSNRKIEWISVQGTTAFLIQDDLYSAVKSLFDEYDFQDGNKICVEFTKSILEADRERVLKGIADLKVLGVKTLISGFAADGFPTSSLLDVAVDAVVLAPEITALALDRNKPGVLSSLIRFIRSMDVAIIADGANTDDEIRELNKAECFGFIPSKSYSGRFDITADKLDFASALVEKEDV